MGIVKIADDAPSFANGSPLSPTALNILRDNALALDEASRLGGYIFAGLYGQPPEQSSITDPFIWRGGFVFVAGMTTLTIEVFSTGLVRTGDTLRVYRGDNNSVFSEHTLAAGAQTFTASIATGYTPGQAIRVRCAVHHIAVPPDSYDGILVDVVLISAGPIGLAGWPGLPAFAVAADVNASRLNQLAACQDWLIRRVSLRYDPLFIASLRRVGPFRDATSQTSQQTVIWKGGLRRTAIHGTLTVRGLTRRVWGGATEVIELRINGALVSTYAVPTSFGESSWELTAPLNGYADGSLLRVSVQYLRTVGSDTAGTINAWSLHEAFTAAPLGTPASLTAWEIRQAGVTEAALLGWLSSLATLTNAAYTRIAANGALWASQRLYTARHAFDDYQFKVYEPWGVPISWRRTGEALVVRGRGLSIGYGPGRILEEQNEVGAYLFENFKTATVVDADNVETTQFYLDSAPGLPAGAPYNLRGIESYVAMERLKVVEEA